MTLTITVEDLNIYVDFEGRSYHVANKSGEPAKYYPGEGGWIGGGMPSLNHSGTGVQVRQLIEQIAAGQHPSTYSTMPQGRLYDTRGIVVRITPTEIRAQRYGGEELTYPNHAGTLAGAGVQVAELIAAVYP